jgi:hypothetical protein
MFMDTHDQENLFPDAGNPELNFKEDRFDFGKIKQGDIVKHNFVCSNKGDVDLVLKDVRTSCGCTAANVADSKISPGKKGKIKVVFDSKGFSEKVNVYINIESNDPVQPFKQLLISADVEGPPQPRIELDHFKQDLGVILEQEVLQGKIKIKNTGETALIFDLRHKDAVIYTAGEKAVFPMTVTSKNEIELVVKIPTMNKSGFVREYVLVISNDPKRPKLSVNLCGYVISRERLKDLLLKNRDILDSR